MNVDEKSADYGKFLTYGKTGMTTAQILAQSEEGGGWLPLIQVSATYNSAFNWNVSVTKDGGSSYGESGDIKLQKEGYDGTKYSFPATQVVSTIKISQAAAADSAYMGLGENNIVGKYVVDVKVNGVSEKKETLTIGDYVKISGTLSPAYGTYAIAGATIKYTVDGKEETAVSKETGAYDFKVLKGSVVVFKSITYPGDVFTFKGLKSLGTVTSDRVLNINAEQSVTTVTVKDNSSAAVPIKDAKLTLSWYYEKSNTGSKYYVESASDGVAKICGNSGVDGKISIAYVEPTDKKDYKAVLVGSASLTSGDYYTFDTKDVVTDTSGEGVQISTQITSKNGTKIIYSDDSETLPTFKAKESTLTVTVKEAGGNNPVVGATVTASFYEEKIVSDKADVKVLDGVIKSIGTTDINGKVKLTYVVPTGTEGYTAYMLISATSAPGFTFASKTALTTGSTVDTINKQIDGCSATVAITVGSSNPVVKAKEIAFRVDVKATNVPAGKSVTFNYTDGIGTSVVSGKATASLSDVTAYFYVLKDKSPAITATLDGYVLKCDGYTTWTVPTVTANVSTPITFIATSTTEIVDLVKPNAYGSDGKVTASTGQKFSVSLPNIANNKPVTFEYTVDGVTYKNTVLSEGQKASLYIYSWNSIIAFTSVTAPGYTVSIVDGAIADGPAKVIKEYTITFKDRSAATANVVGIDVAVYLDVDKAPIATVKANAIGVAKFKTEEIGAKMVYFKCNGVFVSKAFVDTTFAYDVDISAAIEAAPVKVTEYTVNYFATDVNANASDSDHTAYSMIMAPQIVNVGSDVKINAPEVSGYKFVGWMMDGKIVSADAEYTLNVTTNPLEKVNAIYEQHLVSEPKDGGIDSTTLIIGIAAVVIALIAVIYAVIQKKQ